MNIYETDQLLAQYLLFHYGEQEQILPYPEGPKDALNYPVRTVAENLEVDRLPDNSRALDLGCAVGRSTFELARHCKEVVGIDFSQAFISAAQSLADHQSLNYFYKEEGSITHGATAKVGDEIDCSRVSFETGDAMNLHEDLGMFDVIHMANLIDRLERPGDCLGKLAGMMNLDGQLIITSPYTWLDEFTPPSNWVGGYNVDGVNIRTLEGLKNFLRPEFKLERSHNMPFLIREHARKFQWSVAEASVWTRL